MELIKRTWGWMVLALKERKQNWIKQRARERDGEDFISCEQQSQTQH